MQKQRLQQQQKLKISHKQIQFLLLLQTPLIDLENRVQEELEENPALEEIDVEDPEEDSGYLFQKKKSSSPEKTIAEKPLTLSEFLHNQLIEIVLSDEEDFLVRYLIDSLDENGFLTRDLHVICSDLLVSFNMDVHESALSTCLGIIQNFEPIGVGATSVQESLLLQLKKKESTSIRKMAITILTTHYLPFMNKNFDFLTKQIDAEELSLIYKEIETLNPFPAVGFSENSEGSHFIVPDFTITSEENALRVVLNKTIEKKIRVNRDYKKMLEEAKDVEVKTFLKEKIESAQWFQNALTERDITLKKIMEAIIYFQEKYFKSGHEKDLRPMKLMDIAQVVKMDISTISRMSNSKYVETFFGTFLVKDLFSEAYKKEDGSVISTKEIKNRLKELVETEDKKIPLSDDQLAEILGGEEYLIARRTVAKYRASLSIPIAKLRRKL